MKVCVLQPDYSTTGVDYKNYDPPSDLSPLIPEHEVDHVFLNKLTTFRQLKELRKRGMIYLSISVKDTLNGKFQALMCIIL